MGEQRIVTRHLTFTYTYLRAAVLSKILIDLQSKAGTQPVLGRLELLKQVNWKAVQRSMRGQV